MREGGDHELGLCEAADLLNVGERVAGMNLNQGALQRWVLSKTTTLALD